MPAVCAKKNFTSNTIVMNAKTGLTCMLAGGALYRIKQKLNILLLCKVFFAHTAGNIM